jgi:hypothetical protein
LIDFEKSIVHGRQPSAVTTHNRARVSLVRIVLQASRLPFLAQRTLKKLSAQAGRLRDTDKLPWTVDRGHILFLRPVIDYRYFIQMGFQYLNKGLMIRMDQISIPVFLTGKGHEKTMGQSLI